MFIVIDRQRLAAVRGHGVRGAERHDLGSPVGSRVVDAYAEHISKEGAMIAGYEQTTRVNEPGRTAWLKTQLSFE